MGGFQPFLRAVAPIGMGAKLMLVDGPKRQTAARRDRYRPVPKRSETAQLFLAMAFLAMSRGLQATSWGSAVGPQQPGRIAHPSSIRAQRPAALGGRFGARRWHEWSVGRPWVPTGCSNSAATPIDIVARRNGRRDALARSPRDPRNISREL